MAFLMVPRFHSTAEGRLIPHSGGTSPVSPAGSPVSGRWRSQEHIAALTSGLLPYRIQSSVSLFPGLSW